METITNKEKRANIIIVVLDLKHQYISLKGRTLLGVNKKP